MRRQAVALAIAPLVVALGCGETLATDDSPSPVDAGADGDGGADAETDGGACGFARAPAILCGGQTCDAAGGEACCVDGPRRTCGLKEGGCAGTQMNCQGAADCPKGSVCCQAGSSIGSQCLADCAGRPRYCYGGSDCDPGEACQPLDRGEAEVRACAPCR